MTQLSLSSTAPLPLIKRNDARERALHKALLVRIRFARVVFGLLFAGALLLLGNEVWFAQHFGWRTSVPLPFRTARPPLMHPAEKAR